MSGEISGLAKKLRRRPLVVLDEVQKVPELMDELQELIDKKTAQFVLTGSSARKLKKSGVVNLLPGRLVNMRLDPFIHEEASYDDILKHIFYGSLPGIFVVQNAQDKEVDLKSYVESYLEEEVRSEALVRQIGSFVRFLEYAGLESGNNVSFRALSQEIGVSHTTIMSYFDVLEDCLIVERVEPITKSLTRKKLLKSCKYILFDLGIRRVCAQEGFKMTPERLGQIFEQYVGLELIRRSRLSHDTKVRFWKDPDGPEVDWVLEKDGEYIPVEVKWTDSPLAKHARHVQVFLSEYKTAKKGYVVCRTPNSVELEKNVTAISWKDISQIFD
ncbi:MAG TPA: DUF4143 domain-containing protein [bacterium]|nr:DUF4143 domain-containing protein [bacterium]